MRGLPNAFQTISIRGFTGRQRRLLIWFVIAAWLLFGGSGYIELALANRAPKNPSKSTQT
jgi:hypothetical protein